MVDTHLIAEKSFSYIAWICICQSQGVAVDDLFLTDAELAAAVLLVVEIVLLDELEAAFLKAAFAPVPVPPDDIGIEGDGMTAGLVDLVEAFPAGGGEGGGDDPEAMLMGIRGSTLKADTETLQTAAAALRLAFKASDRSEPTVMVIVGIDDFKAEGLRISAAFILPDQIFLLWPDVWVAIEYDGPDAASHQTFDDGRRAWRTACVQQHRLLPAGHIQIPVHLPEQAFLIFHSQANRYDSACKHRQKMGDPATGEENNADFFSTVGSNFYLCAEFRNGLENAAF